MTIDINLGGWRFYVSLSQPKPKVAESNDSPPTSMNYPMQVHPGRLGYYQTRAAEDTEAKK
jgi:hypothetical protein